MAIIGTFAPTRDGGWAGSIRTLTINVKVRFVPNDNRDSERAPEFRVFAGRSELPGEVTRVGAIQGSISASVSTIRVWSRDSRPHF